MSLKHLFKAGANKTKNKPQRKVRIDDASPLRRILEIFIVAFFVTLIVEGFNQGTVPRTLRYLSGNILCFLMNILIVFTSLSLSELVRRRRAVLTLISVIWLVLGFVNYMVSHDRTLPLAGGDLILTYEVAALITVYFTWYQILAMFLAAVAVIAAIVWMFSNSSRRAKVSRLLALGFVGAMLAIVVLYRMLMIHLGLLPRDFPDRVNSYREFGFTTCFTFTFGQKGIDKPEAYSSELVDDILDDLDDDTVSAAPTSEAARFDDASMRKPNIIFVQLESFFDTDTMLGTQLSEDPMPVFHRLLRSHPSGLLYVPTIGGGTANVEFEVMSGFNMDFFGAGETPYSTIILETTCETLADVLREHGYSSTAMHNNTGTFFSRNQVYRNLGFDRFDCLETMPSPKYNDVGWAKDDILTGQILRTLRATPERDLIFTISVASHGKYSDEYTYKSGDIRVLHAPEEIFLAPFQNYVNVIPAVDSFLGELIDALENYEEPVLAIIYGDHLPGVGLTPSMIDGEDFYASRYIVWNNYGGKFETPDLQAYRLGSELLRQLGIQDGVMTRFHQSYAVDDVSEHYLENLRVLEYDLLYGDKLAYGEAGAPKPTELQLGLEPVQLSSASLEYGRLMVTGEHFTEFSRVVADDDAMLTLFIDDKHIAVPLEVGLDEFPSEICVAQMTSDGKELCRTGTIAVEKLPQHQ